MENKAIKMGGAAKKRKGKGGFDLLFFTFVKELSAAVFFTCQRAGEAGIIKGKMCIRDRTNNSEPEKLASRMSYLAALTSVFTAIGYLLGGVIGERSVFWDFALQVGGITLVAILMPLLVAEELPETAPNAPKQSLNPLKAFISMGKGMSAPLGLFLAAVFFANFATIDYDNAFNYYIKAELGFPPSYNGIIKAAIGIIGLLLSLIHI